MDQVKELLKRARQLRDDSEAALKNHLSATQGRDFLGSILSLEAVSDFLYEAWEETAAFRSVRARFDTLYDEVAALLSTVVGPSGRSASGRLKEVAQAKRLDTRIRRLITALESLSIQPIRYAGSRSKAQAARSTKHRPRARPASSHGDAWGFIGLAAGILLGVAAAAVPFVGWVWGVFTAVVMTAITLGLLLRTKPLWLPKLTRALSK